MTDPMDEAMLRRSFDVARRALAAGNHPFGAILVGPDGAVLVESENGFLPDRDMTAHAERLLATRASTMCAGAAYWAGIGRVVYGLSEARLKEITGDHPENPTLDVPCRRVFDGGQRRVEVVGPLLEVEAEALHRLAWTRRP
jgi:tRNA(Arg) A34 adenosine deaminase TadA